MNGSTVHATKTVTAPATTIDALPANPTNGNYTFSGWYTGTNGSGTGFYATTPVTSDLTVYAFWTSGNSIHTVTYNLDIGTFVGGSVRANVTAAEAGQRITLTVTPDTGYELYTIEVYRKDNRSTTVSLSGTGNTRTFTMPAYHVTIVATFRETRTGVEDSPQSNGLKAFVQNGILHVRGLTVGQSWNVYNVSGMTVYQGIASEEGVEIVLPGYSYGRKRGG